MIKHIKPLPISEEMLGAYLEGNLTAEDSSMIQSFIDNNSDFRILVEEISASDPTLEESIYDVNPDFEQNFKLPKIQLNLQPQQNIVNSNPASKLTHPELALCCANEDYSNLNSEDSLEENLLINENINYTFDIGNNKEEVLANNSEYTEEETYSSSSILLEKNKSNRIMSDKLTIGYEPNLDKDTFDPQIYQGQNPTCAICSQEIILRDFGIDIPREDLIKFATDKGWFYPDPQYGGTPKEAVGNILDAFGIQTNRYNNASYGDIFRELAAGHRLIVNVDADELWIQKEPELHKRLFGYIRNKVNDTFQNTLGIEGANHALIVAGININPNDPSDVHVTLIDSGSGDYCIEYTWEQFSDALADSNNYIIATKEAAPFQYNYKTHEFEPSGFNSNFIPSLAQLPNEIHNRFLLPDNYYERYEYHTPIFNSDQHLNQIGDNIASESSETFNGISEETNELPNINEYEYSSAISIDLDYDLGNTLDENTNNINNDGDNSIEFSSNDEY